METDTCDTTRRQHDLTMFKDLARTARILGQSIIRGAKRLTLTIRKRGSFLWLERSTTRKTALMKLFEGGDWILADKRKKATPHDGILTRFRSLKPLFFVIATVIDIHKMKAKDAAGMN